MSTHEERKWVFQDTLNWINEDDDLACSIPKAKKETRVYFEDDYPDFDISKEKAMTVTVTGDRSMM